MKNILYSSIKTLLVLGFFLNSAVSMAQDSEVAREARAYIEEDTFTIWNVSDKKEAVIFANMAYIREEPNSKSLLLDSLPVGSAIKFIGNGAYNQTFIRGMELPWYHIEYTVNNKKKKGYIWLGLVSLDVKKDPKTGNQFIYGFPWKSNEEDNIYYWCELKVLDASKKVIASKSFPFYHNEQSYTIAEFTEPNGTPEAKSIYSIQFLGEACGISTQVFNFAWTGNKLIDLPKTTSVSDAGVFYYSEELLFPNQHKKGKKLIVKAIEEGESETDINDETVSEIKYKVKKSEETYEWDGTNYVKKNI